MVEKTLVVLGEEGLHTRPANQFVKVAKNSSSEVTLTKGETQVPGKNLLKLMKLGIVKGDTITLTCQGSDEQQVLDALVALIQPGDHQ